VRKKEKKKLFCEFFFFLQACDLMLGKKIFSNAADILNLFSDSIKDSLTSELQEKVCGAIEPLVNTNLTIILQTVDAQLEPYMNPTFPTPGPLPTDFIRWGELSTMQSIANFTNTKGVQATKSAINFLSNGTGDIEIPVNQVIHYQDYLANYTITIHSVVLANLSTISKLELDFPDEAGLHFGLRIENLLLEAKLSLELDSNVASQILKFDPVLSMSISGIEFDITDVLAINGEFWKDLVLIQLFNPACPLASIFSANFSNVNLTYDSIDYMGAYGFGTDFDQIVNDTLSMALRLVEPFTPTLVSNTLNYIATIPVNQAISSFLASGEIPLSFLEEYVDSDNVLGSGYSLEELVGNGFNASCVVPTPPTYFHLVNFQTNTFMKLISGLIQSTIGNMDSDYSINAIMNKLTHGTGAFTLPNEVFSFQLDDPSSGQLNLTISDLTIAGLNSFDSLEIFLPVSPYELDLGFSFGHCDAVSCNPFILIVDAVVDYNGRGTEVHELMHIELEVDNMAFYTRWDVELNNEAFWTVPVTDLAQGAPCLLSYMEKLAMTQFNLTLTHVEMASNLTDPVYEEEPDKVTVLILDVVEIFRPIILSTVNGKLNTLLEDSTATCENSSSSGSNSTLMTGVGIGIGAGFLVIAGAAFLRHRHNRKSKKASQRSVDELVVSLANSDEEPTSGTWREFFSTSLCNHEVVPLWARIAIPLSIIATIALFISAHVSVGASVGIYLNYGDSTLYHMSMFEFTLSNSINDMWEAKVYALSILIAVCSGGWPYVKSVFVGIAWVVPRKYFSQHRRDTMLTWLDILGKWSLIDAFVLVIFIVAFRFHVANPEMMGIPFDIAAADVFVRPDWGIHGFIIAAILQLILTHGVIYYHREAEGKQDSMRRMTNGAPEAVRSHTYKANHGKIAFRCTKTGQISVGLVVVICVALVVVGSVLISFTFVFEGAAGEFSFFFYISWIYCVITIYH
jgi:hypothetical protein